MNSILGQLLIYLTVPILLQGIGNDPIEVVETFCREDFNGARLTHGNRRTINNLMLWEIEPGWDSRVIVGGYQVTEVYSSADTVKARVDYEVLGDLVPTRFYPFTSSPIDSTANHDMSTLLFTVIRDSTGWHITDPVFPPMVSPESALKELKELQSEEKRILGDASRWNDVIKAIEELITSRPPPPQLIIPDATH